MSKTLQKNSDYKKFVVDSRLQYFKPYSTRVEKTFAEEIHAGLGNDPKSIASKFFYDQKGSELFEKICALPEYYPTRTEISILENIRDDLSEYLGKDCRLVELGSGTSVKTRLLLDIFNEIDGIIEYFPIDISDILAESSERLLAEYAKLHIAGIIDAYEGGLDFLRKIDGKQSLIIFLGSSYGNFHPAEGMELLKAIYSAMKPGDLFLIGLDMIKDKDDLESAYNDSAGITAEFNLNVLSRINNELDADFDLANFEHYATYNQEEQRVEMYVKSLVNQSIQISKSNQIVRLNQGELISTEYSYKFSPEKIYSMLHKIGFGTKHMWKDGKGYFSLTLASKD